MKLVLRILSLAYGFVALVRGWLYDCNILSSYKSVLPVISIGNITAGGNGKTPLCVYIAEELAKRGCKPAILSRGYGGKNRGPHRVEVNDTPDDVGDEPIVMAARGISVYVSRSRVSGVKLIEREGQCDVVVLDDGLQHRALHRDVDIVSIFAGTNRAIEDFVRGELLPLGMFREPRRRALDRATLVVVSQRKVMAEGELPEVDDRILKLLPAGITVFRSCLQPAGVTWLESGAQLQPTAVCAFAGIANPEGFFQSLEQLGYKVERRLPFADHHTFSDIELKRMIAEHPSVPLVCTAKDAVKLSGMSSTVRSRIAVLHVVARVVPSDAFMVALERRIKS